MADALQDAAEALVEQLLASLAKEQALLDLLTRDGGPRASDEGIPDSDD